jgi:hypothetical protein
VRQSRALKRANRLERASPSAAPVSGRVRVVAPCEGTVAPPSPEGRHQERVLSQHDCDALRVPGAVMIRPAAVLEGAITSWKRRGAQNSPPWPVNADSTLGARRAMQHHWRADVRVCLDLDMCFRRGGGEAGRGQRKKKERKSHRGPNNACNTTSNAHHHHLDLHPNTPKHPASGLEASPPSNGSGDGPGGPRNARAAQLA